MQMMSFNTRLNWFPCIYTKRVYTFWIGLHTKTISISPVCGPFYSSININGRTQSEKKTHTESNQLTIIVAIAFSDGKGYFSGVTGSRSSKQAHCIPFKAAKDNYYITSGQSDTHIRTLYRFCIALLCSFVYGAMHFKYYFRLNSIDLISNSGLSVHSKEGNTIYLLGNVIVLSSR